MNNKARTIFASAAPVVILGVLLYATNAQPRSQHTPDDQYLPGDEIKLIEHDPHDTESRRRGILIPKRVKEILSYQRTALA